MEKPVHMLRKAKKCRPFRSLIGADSFEHRSAIMEGMAHDVNVGMIPFIKFSHIPELFCPGKMGVIKHYYSLYYGYIL
jgi:hypothetical protein